MRVTYLGGGIRKQRRSEKKGKTRCIMELVAAVDDWAQSLLRLGERVQDTSPLGCRKVEMKGKCLDGGCHHAQRPPHGTHRNRSEPGACDAERKKQLLLPPSRKG